MTDLAALHADAGVPAILALDDQATLVIQRSARYVPDRRLVCEATWQQQKVYAKIFTGEQARRYAARDSYGSLLLTNAGLLTPALLHEATLDDGQAHVLIYAAVMVTGNAEDDLRKLASGPGKLCEALGITRPRDNDKDMLCPESDLQVMSDSFRVQEVAVTQRIGITKAAELPLRYVIARNAFLSKK